MTSTRLTKKELEQKRFIAEIMFMNFEDQKVIADHTGISAKTIGEWVEKFKWKEKRSASTVTRPELVNKILANINKMLDEALAATSNKDFGSISDYLIKMSNAIEKLDKKNSVVNEMEAFMTFNKWLQKRMLVDKKLKLDDTKLINEFQNIYISERMNNDQN